MKRESLSCKILLLFAMCLKSKEKIISKLVERFKNKQYIYYILTTTSKTKKKLKLWQI